jgi:hypothetical protein
MEVDPAASVQVWAIEIDLGGRTFVVPALPASHWLPVLLDGNPLLVLDLLESTPVDEDVDSLILSGQVGPAELVEALTVAVEQAAGRDFHSAFVIAQVARSQWAAVSGVLAEKGFRWDQSPLGAALDAIYAIVIKHLDEEKLTRFHHLLDNPLSVTAGRRRPADRAKAMEQFETMAGPKPEGVPATAARSGSARSRTRTRPRPRHPAAP